MNEETTIALLEGELQAQLKEALAARAAETGAPLPAARAAPPANPELEENIRKRLEAELEAQREPVSPTPATSKDGSKRKPRPGPALGKNGRGGLTGRLKGGGVGMSREQAEKARFIAAEKARIRSRLRRLAPLAYLAVSVTIGLLCLVGVYRERIKEFLRRDRSNKGAETSQQAPATGTDNATAPAFPKNSFAGAKAAAEAEVDKGDFHGGVEVLQRFKQAYPKHEDQCNDQIFSIAERYAKTKASKDWQDIRPKFDELVKKGDGGDGDSYQKAIYLLDDFIEDNPSEGFLAEALVERLSQKYFKLTKSFILRKNLGGLDDLLDDENL